MKFSTALAAFTVAACELTQVLAHGGVLSYDIGGQIYQGFVSNLSPVCLSHLAVNASTLVSNLTTHPSVKAPFNANGTPMTLSSTLRIPRFHATSTEPISALAN